MISIPTKQRQSYDVSNKLQQKDSSINTANEETLITSLSAIAHQIMNTLQIEKEQQQSKMANRQKEFIRRIENQQKLITELTKINEQISNENKELRLRLDQSLRHQKRCQMNIQLLNNKIKSVQHQLTQKEAVIKYLENKNQDIGNYNLKKIVNNSYNNINVSLDESLSSYRSKDLSFAKFKDTKLKFEDFSYSSNLFRKQSEQTSSYKNKTKRIRTQSSHDLKQNQNQDNISHQSKTTLNDFLDHKNRIWQNSQDKTLTKKTRRNSSNLWLFQNNRQSLQGGNQPKNNFFNNSSYLYNRPEQTFINSKNIIN